MLIKRPRGLSGLDIAIGITLGVLSGVYIWRPILKDYFSVHDRKKREENSNKD